MRGTRFLLICLAALAVAGCMRQQQTYYVDPRTGQPVLVQAEPAFAQQPTGLPRYAPEASGQTQLAEQYYEQYAQQTGAPPAYQSPAYRTPYAAAPPPQPSPPQAAQYNGRALYSSSPAYAQQTYEQPAYAQAAYQPVAAPPQAHPQPAPSTSRGLFNTSGLFSGRSSAPGYAAQQPPPAQNTGRGLFNMSGLLSARPSAPVYAPQPQPAYVPQPQPQPAYVPQQRVPQYAAPQLRHSLSPQYTGATGGPYVAAPAYAYAVPPPAYTLGSGDKLRIVVFGQEGITNTYLVGADGCVNLPLVGSVPARGFTTQQLARMIAERLKQGYVREPHVSVEIEAYRPFFILGEVTTPGQYPYVANMTAETAVAIAGGFAPRADKTGVILTHNMPGAQFRGPVPLNYPVQPGDTVVVKERWF